MKLSIKAISVILLLVIILSLGAGCGQNADTSAKDGQSQSQTGNITQTSVKKEAMSNFNTTGYPIVNEKITLKMMGSKHAMHGPWEDMYFFKKLEEVTNIHFEITTVPQESWEEKKNLTLASGDLPDVFYKARLTDKDATLYGSQGIFIPMEDLIDDYAPVLKDILGKNEKVKQLITSRDGHIYSLPQINDNRMVLTERIWYNKKWTEQLGIKEPKTLDDFYEMLKAFKEKDPNKNGKADEIPLSFYDINQTATILGAFGVQMHNNLVSIDDNGKYYFTPLREEYKEYLKYMRKLWAEGLIDPDAFTQQTSQVQAKAKQDIIGTFYMAAPWFAVGVEKNFDYTHLPALEGPNEESYYPGAYAMGAGTFAITNVNKYPHETMRWADYLYSEDGWIALMLGEENTHWKWTNDKKETYEYILPEGKDFSSYQAEVISPFAGGSTPFINYIDLYYKVYEEPPLTRWFQENSFAAVGSKLREVYPVLNLSTEQQKEVSTVQADIKPYVNEMRAKFIIGTADIDKEWDAYAGKLKQMGTEKYTEIFQKAYDTK